MPSDYPDPNQINPYALAGVILLLIALLAYHIWQDHRPQPDEDEQD